MTKSGNLLKQLISRLFWIVRRWAFGTSTTCRWTVLRRRIFPIRGLWSWVAGRCNRRSGLIRIVFVVAIIIWKTHTGIWLRGFDFGDKRRLGIRRTGRVYWTRWWVGMLGYRTLLLVTFVIVFLCIVFDKVDKRTRCIDRGNFYSRGLRFHRLAILNSQGCSKQKRKRSNITCELAAGATCSQLSSWWDSDKYRDIIKSERCFLQRLCALRWVASPLALSLSDSAE